MHLACQIVKGTKSLIDNKDNIIALHLYGPFHTEGPQRHFWLTSTTRLEMWLLFAAILEHSTQNEITTHKSTILLYSLSPHPHSFGPS